MANTEHLPIFKRAYDLCLYLDQVVRGFPRYHKHGLGADLRDCARTVLRLVVRANSRRERVETLLELRETVEELKVLLRLACDAKAFPKVSSFEHAVTLAVDIARQNEGWLRSQQARPGDGERQAAASPAGAAGAANAPA